jgi:2TM domain
MPASTITLQDYEQAERVMAHEGARVGVIMHGIITVLVSALLLVLNLTVAQGFPWSAFAIAGMAIGLGTHWWFGYRNLDMHLTAQQRKTEARAAQLR